MRIVKKGIMQDFETKKEELGCSVFSQDFIK
jgi:hypothetical protein